MSVIVHPLEIGHSKFAWDWRCCRIKGVCVLISDMQTGPTVGLCHIIDSKCLKMKVFFSA
uniref:Uncharacterized protein n=1 Tax=Anguilla anguilla TaxID=7936 RepID=A0A0E9QPS4_ANGAN